MSSFTLNNSHNNNTIPSSSAVSSTGSNLFIPSINTQNSQQNSNTTEILDHFFKVAYPQQKSNGPLVNSVVPLHHNFY